MRTSSQALRARAARLRSRLRGQPILGSALGAAPVALLAVAVSAGSSAPAHAHARRHLAHAAAASTPAPTTSATPAPSPPKPTVPKPTVLYRIVGCRSHGAVAYRQGPARKAVAIGFDDGPWSDTQAFVSMLERSHTRATFFMIGDQVSARYRSLLLRELRDGDVLGDHSYTHPVLTASGDVFSQLLRTIGAIRSLTGYRPCVFRPPYGAVNGSVVATARSLGLATVLWNVDPTDWARPGTAAIEQRVLSQVRPGSIILSHDGGGPRWQTLAAYPHIIAALHARGYRIVTIAELLGFRPVYVPCIRLCEGIGVARDRLPRGAIVQRAP